MYSRFNLISYINFWDKKKMLKLANRIYLESEIIVKSKVSLNQLINTFNADDVNVRVMGISMAGDRVTN